MQCSVDIGRSVGDIASINGGVNICQGIVVCRVALDRIPSKVPRHRAGLTSKIRVIRNFRGRVRIERIIKLSCGGCRGGCWAR